MNNKTGNMEHIEMDFNKFHTLFDRKNAELENDDKLSDTEMLMLLFLAYDRFVKYYMKDLCERFDSPDYVFPSSEMIFDNGELIVKNLHVTHKVIEGYYKDIADNVFEHYLNYFFNRFDDFEFFCRFDTLYANSHKISIKNKKVIEISFKDMIKHKEKGDMYEKGNDILFDEMQISFILDDMDR